MKMDVWSEGVDKNLVPLDRTGDPLYFFVTKQTLPEVPVGIVNEVEEIVRNSIELYYETNTIRGCTKLGSPNFSFSANFDDGSCDVKTSNLAFGGVYQTCEVSGTFHSKNPCDGLDEVNPKTGKYTCQDSFKEILIQKAVKPGITEFKENCYTCWGFYTCCDPVKSYQANAIYSAYWCAPTGPVRQESGYLFGGMYRPTQDNPVTGNKGCPPSFYPRNILSDVTICISDDFEHGRHTSVPFGGFFSCKAGNPLADTAVSSSKAAETHSLKAFMAKLKDPLISYPMRCPEGYSQHLASVDDGCSVNYCVKTGALAGPNLPPIRRPPYMTKPITPTDSEDNVVVFDTKHKTWMKSEDAVTFLKEHGTTFNRKYL